MCVCVCEWLSVCLYVCLPPIQWCYLLFSLEKKEREREVNNTNKMYLGIKLNGPKGDNSFGRVFKGTGARNSKGITGPPLVHPGRQQLPWTLSGLQIDGQTHGQINKYKAKCQKGMCVVSPGREFNSKIGKEWIREWMNHFSTRRDTSIYYSNWRRRKRRNGINEIGVFLFFFNGSLKEEM